MAVPLGSLRGRTRRTAGGRFHCARSCHDLETKEASSELQKLRQEVGYLDVADPSRIHAVQVPGVESMLWKWRLHLPPGRQYSLHTATLDIPAAGFPVGGKWTFDAPEGANTLTVALRKDHLGQWQMVASLPQGTVRIGIADDDAAGLRAITASPRAVSVRARRRYRAGPARGNARVHAHRNGRNGTSTPDGPAKGVLVWLGEE